jgi:DNA sulfur modification protein DndD
VPIGVRTRRRLTEYESLLIEGSEQGRQIKEAIEQVLGVPALINGRTELGAILKSATKRQSSELSHIQGLEKQAERQQELTAKQDAHDRDLQELQAKLTRVRADRNKLDDDLEAAASVLAAKGKLDALLAQKKSFEEIRERKRTERQLLLGQAWQDLLDVKLEVKRAQLQKRQTVLTQGLKEQGRLLSRIEDLARLLQSNECPTCGQELGGDRRSQLGTSLGKLQAEASKISDENDDLQSVSAQLASLNKIRGVNSRERIFRSNVQISRVFWTALLLSSKIEESECTYRSSSAQI